MAAPSSSPICVSDLSRLLEDLMPGLCGVIPPLAKIIAQYAAPDPPSIMFHSEFKSPEYITVSSDLIFVSDSRANRVFCFRMDGSFVLTIGSEGSDEGQLKIPLGLYLSLGCLYVADSANRRISVFRADGVFVRNWLVPFRPWGLAFGEGLFFITDYDADCIHAYRPDGTLERSFGSPAESDVELVGPMGIAYWDHHVFVTFLYGVSVHRTNGSFVRRIGVEGSDPGQFFLPHDVAVCGGQLIISDKDNHRVCVHSLDGAFIRSVGSPGSADDQFQQPIGVAVTPHWVFIADRSSKRVRVLPSSTLVENSVSE